MRFDSRIVFEFKCDTSKDNGSFATLSLSNAVLECAEGPLTVLHDFQVFLSGIIKSRDMACISSSRVGYHEEENGSECDVLYCYLRIGMHPSEFDVNKKRGLRRKAVNYLIEDGEFFMWAGKRQVKSDKICERKKANFG